MCSSLESQPRRLRAFVRQTNANTELLQAEKVSVFSNKTKHFSFLVLKTPKAWIFFAKRSPFSYTRPIPIVWWMPVLLLEPIASKHNNHMRAIWEKAHRPEDDDFVLKGYRLTFSSSFSTLLPAELTCVFNRLLMCANVYHAYFRKHEKHIRFQ